MKLPSINFNNFFKKPSTNKKRTTTTTTTFGKRRTSSTSSARKTHRSSSGRKPRKRSITYYAPSKSKFYPTEYFPSLQRVATQATAVAATPIAAQFFQTNQTVSTDMDQKLSHFPSNGTHRTQMAKHTYLCDDNQNFNSNQTIQWYGQTGNRDGLHYSPESMMVGMIENHLLKTSAADPNGNFVYDENYPSSHSIHFNDNNNAYFSKECLQGVPDSFEMHKQHNYLPSNLVTAYESSTSLKHMPGQQQQHNHQFNAYSASNQMSQLSLFAGMQPATKKLDRYRRRKVSI